MTYKSHGLSFIPPLLPGQTLYSWVAMYHALSGNVNEAETLVQLFGAWRSGMHFHIPSRLDRFCAATQMSLGDADKLIQDTTIIPAYLKFCARIDLESVVRLLRGDVKIGVAKTLQIAPSRLYGSPARRFCPECICDDLKVHGYSYWHRAHQLPGALVCLRHGVPLLVREENNGARPQLKFFSPESDFSLFDNSRWWGAYTRQQLEVLIRLARISSSMAMHHLKTAISAEAVQKAGISALSERGLLSGGENKCGALAVREYQEHFCCVGTLPALACISRKATKSLNALLGDAECSAHPLEYILLVDWLFGSWEDFLRKYDACLSYKD